jgi:hypothetical protein
MASLKSLSVRGAVEKQLMLPLKVENMYSSWPGFHLKQREVRHVIIAR